MFLLYFNLRTCAIVSIQWLFKWTLCVLLSQTKAVMNVLGYWSLGICSRPSLGYLLGRRRDLLFWANWGKIQSRSGDPEHIACLCSTSWATPTFDKASVCMVLAGSVGNLNLLTIWIWGGKNAVWRGLDPLRCPDKHHLYFLFMEPQRWLNSCPLAPFFELTHIPPGTPFFASAGWTQCLWVATKRSLTDTAIQRIRQSWWVGESSVDPRQDSVLSPTMFTALPWTIRPPRGAGSGPFWGSQSQSRKIHS